jgi:hypothetical protein
MTPSQIATLLELFPGPARLYNDSGAVVAQNERARGGGVGSDWAVGVRQDLGDGWHIRTWSKERREAETQRVEKRRVTTRSRAHPTSARWPTAWRTAFATLCLDCDGSRSGARRHRDQRRNRDAAGHHQERSESSQPHSDRLFCSMCGHKSFNPAVFDLGEAAAQTAAGDGRELPQDISIDVEYSLPGSSRWGDEVQIRGALWNIMRNAAEAMPDGGRLVCGARSQRACRFCASKTTA